MNNWKRIVVCQNMSILDAMKIIDSAGTQFVMVLGEDDTLEGVVTDGDVRRGILRDLPLSSPVKIIMNTQPRCLPNDISRTEISEFLHKNRISHVPLIDKDRRVTGVVSYDERVGITGHSSTAVLMVGGLGSRLGELTSNCPKPMLPIGGKPVLQILVENLKEHGFTDFVFCVNYRAEMIQAHFGDGSAMGIRVRYVEEPKRMGTAGALGLIPEDVSSPLLVMNGDIVTKVNFAKLMEFHSESQALATMAVRKYDFQIPFGVVKTEEGRITGIDEKPVHSFMVSAGIYVVEKESIKLIPENEFFDMPHFFESMMKDNKLTQAFPIHEYWLDIGREDDLIRAQREFSEDG